MNVLWILFAWLLLVWSWCLDLWHKAALDNELCVWFLAGIDQYDRDSIINDFKNGTCKLLVATSVAARGLDVKQLMLVVNYSCPNHYEDYVHRAGRTGRAGNKVCIIPCLVWFYWTFFLIDCLIKVFPRDSYRGSSLCYWWEEGFPLECISGFWAIVHKICSEFQHYKSWNVFVLLMYECSFKSHLLAESLGGFHCWQCALLNL